MADPSQDAFGDDAGRGQSFAQRGGFSRPFQHPADNPQSSYNALRNERFGGDPSQYSAPIPSLHSSTRGPAAQDLAHTQSVRTNSTVTPGVDNLGAAAAGGGIAGIATGVAQANERQSGLDAMRDDIGNGDMARSLGGNDPYASNVPLGAAMDGPGQITPGAASHFTPSERSIPTGYGQPNPYQGAGGLYDGPYRGQHASWGPGNPEAINPDDILDDGDDGFLPDPQRRSVLSLGRNSSHNSLPVAGAAAGAGAAGVAAGAGAGAGGVLGAISNRVSGQTTGSPSGGPAYDAVPGEKSEWLAQQNTGRKKMKWIVGIILAFVIIGAIVGGTVGGVLGSRNSKGSGSSGSDKSATDDTKENGDLGKDSDEIKALMNNPDLHKVFPGVDYTPWGVQYPLCLKWPPSQNNVTRDVAVLSQLTNTIRLYGNDCNQTEMVMHAMDRLELKDMKLWLGVWIDINNKTTNDRQIARLHQIIENTDDKSIFKGVVVGNEVLFAGSNQASTALTDLSNYMKDVKDELKRNGIDLPVATSDLGSNWTDELAKLSDVVMANVHPFFGGVPIDDAASWTWTFWQDKDVGLTKGTNKKQIISEVGWPSSGGNDCAPAETCPDKTSGAVAGIDEMNKFMADWVCQSLDNGTDYFWFEAFDEPWKEQYNEPEKGKEWEDKWGLMDPGRNLKPGIKIPDCGGKTAP